MLGELNIHDPLCEDNDRYRLALFERGVYLIGALLAKTVAIVTLSGGFHFKKLAWTRVLHDETSDGLA